jgi:adenylate cyclase
MTTVQASLQEVFGKLSRLGLGASFVGALIAFLYLAAIDPLPTGETAVDPPDSDEIVIFVAFVAVMFVGVIVLSRYLQRPIGEWHRPIEAGTPASQLPPSVSRRVMNWPLIYASIGAAGWLLSAIFFSLYYNNPSNFVGIAIGGVVTTTIVYFGGDLLWRRLVPTFFPRGNLSAVPAFRPWVQRRLLLAFILIGGLTPILLVILSRERTRALLDAENPEAILDNLILVQLFILAVGLFAAVITAVLVARAIVGPLQALQHAMGRVEKNELNTRVLVTTNDELGYLSERFNLMTDGLRQGEKLRKLFSLYVSREVAKAAVESGAGLGGELVNCSVMFSDIRDFTSLTERMPPSRLVELINRYMTAMVSVIVKHGGVVTKFGGDSILAVFGAPLNPMTDHAHRAVWSAIEMRQALAAFNQEESAAGSPELEAGIGIASGLVVAGNVGGKERIEYTVMGDATNLAARLEEKTKDTGFPILISDETYQGLDAALETGAKVLKDVQIKGKRDRVTAYALAVG